MGFKGSEMGGLYLYGLITLQRGPDRIRIFWVFQFGFGSSPSYRGHSTHLLRLLLEER